MCVDWFVGKTTAVIQPSKWEPRNWKSWNIKVREEKKNRANTNKPTINYSSEKLVPKSNATPAATTSLKKNANPSKSVDFDITILDDSNQNHNEALSNETTENNNNVQNESMNEEDKE